MNNYLTTERENDYLTKEVRTLDTISRTISQIVNNIGGQKSMNADQIQDLWMQLYAVRNLAYDAVVEGR